MTQKIYITFNCQHCGAGLSAPSDSVGKRGKCPKCAKPVVVPKSGGEEEDK